MNKLLENNQVTLVGEIKTEFEFSHEVYGEKFYRFELSVERFSGTKDVLPVVVSERLIDVNQNYTGEKQMYMISEDKINKWIEKKQAK